MTAERGNLSAQVFGTSILSSGTRITLGPGDTYYGSNEIYFKNKQVVRIVACSAAGGGGGGGHGYENIVGEYGRGGGAGGGGGVGNCKTATFKVRNGDSISWDIGEGGAGGAGAVFDLVRFNPYLLIEDSPSVAGSNGGNTTVYMNGNPVFPTLVGGAGGQPGSNAYNDDVGYGGNGGSQDTNLQNAWLHAGDDGQNYNTQWNNMGSGGWGGNGEGSSGLLDNRGIGGTSFGSDPYGGHGGEGDGGGGGGGGGAGRWYDYPYEDYDGEIDNAIRNRGGGGAMGKDGYITISW